MSTTLLPGTPRGVLRDPGRVNLLRVQARAPVPARTRQMPLTSQRRPADSAVQRKVIKFIVNFLINTYQLQYSNVVLNIQLQ